MANDVQSPSPSRPRAARRAAAPEGVRRRLIAGGTEGNERLTVLAGLLLIVLLAALGITILNLGGLLWLHLFLGLLLIGPVALKMASTGYRFMRYYTRDRAYRIKGPPIAPLRLLAPLVVGLTVLVFASGVVLLFIGPDSSLRPDAFTVHKVSFILWIGATALHVLGHLPEVGRYLQTGGASRRALIPGGTGRWLSLGTALVLGLVLAVALIPDFSTWTGGAGAAVLHHHHHH
jgi:hypothetical protein